MMGPMQLDRATIPSGDALLAALVYTPRAHCFHAPVVLAHGLSGSKETMDLLAAYLCGRGHLCVTFDFRGHKLGASTGDLLSADQAAADLDTVARWARETFESPRCVLVGHSMGALLSLVVAADDPRVSGVVAIATGTHPSRGFRGPVGLAMKAQRACYVSGIPVDALLAELDLMAERLRPLEDVPALVIAARHDVLVKQSRVRELADRLGRMADYVEIEANHLDAPQRARGAVAHWLEKLLGKRSKDCPPAADNESNSSSPSYLRAADLPS